MKDKPQGIQKITLNPIRWEWSCPICDTNNIADDSYMIVTCSRKDCGTSFFTNFKKE